MSGHIFLRDRWHGSDDGVYVALRVLAALGGAGQSLRAFREGLPRTATSPEFRIACPDLRKAEILEAVAASLTGYAVDRTDGLRVSGPDGWWLLRASGTEPKLTARCEAADPDGLSRLQRELSDRLAAAGLPTSLC